MTAERPSMMTTTIAELPPAAEFSMSCDNVVTPRTRVKPRNDFGHLRNDARRAGVINR